MVGPNLLLGKKWGYQIKLIYLILLSTAVTWGLCLRQSAIYIQLKSIYSPGLIQFDEAIMIRTVNSHFLFPCFSPQSSVQLFVYRPHLTPVSRALYAVMAFEDVIHLTNGGGRVCPLIIILRRRRQFCGAEDYNNRPSFFIYWLRSERCDGVFTSLFTRFRSR